MKLHLTSEELDGALQGTASVRAAEHMRECAHCAAEVAGTRELLGSMRSQATEAADFFLHHPVAVRRAAPAATGGRMSWAVAFAAVVVMVGALSPVALRHRSTTPAPQAGGMATAVSATFPVSDDALLSSVQNDLSSPVPNDLLPLAGTTTNANATILNK